MAKKKENLNLNNEDLKKRLDELEQNLRDLKFKFQSSRPKNVKETSSIKKEIARILTVLNKKS